MVFLTLRAVVHHRRAHNTSWWKVQTTVLCLAHFQPETTRFPSQRSSRPRPGLECSTYRTSVRTAGIGLESHLAVAKAERSDAVARWRVPEVYVVVVAGCCQDHSVCFVHPERAYPKENKMHTSGELPIVVVAGVVRIDSGKKWGMMS